MKRFLLFSLFIMQLFFMATLQAEVPPKNSVPFSSMLKRVMPAVVNITVQGQLKLPSYMLRSYQPKSPSSETVGPKFRSVGSGVIVEAKGGYIVTNAHLLREATMIVVMLSDGRKLRARKVGIDQATDLAVLQVQGKKLTAIPLANASQLKVGDFVAAIGNPFGLHHTVTSGVVSALNRTNIGRNVKAYENFIQTDAPINPGNSGGALINMNGKLVGINTAIVGPISGNVGIGFAIPTNMVRPIMDQLIKFGKINRGVLGVLVQDFTPNLADAFGMSGVTGALVTEVKAGSAAQKGGLKTKDVVLQVNNTPIKNAAQLQAIIAVFPVGETVKLKVRRDNKDKVIKATIASRAKPSKLQKVVSNPLAGVQLQNYDAFSPKTGELKGVEVTYVDDNSDAWIAGLRPEDVILTTYGKKVETINALLEQVKKNNKDKPLLLSVWRSGGVLFIVLP